MNTLKIVSLVPSGTEIACALGFNKNIVGRSHECDFPFDVKSVPICTQTLIDPSLNSAKIDEQVKYKLINGLSIYRLDVELINSLNPDLIITQSQCNVCAIDANEIKNNFFLSSYEKKINIVSLEASDLDSIFFDIQKIANALNEPLRGSYLTAKIKEDLFALNSQIPILLETPRIVCLEWIDPLMVAGNWIPSLVELAKAENLFSIKGQPSPWIKEKELLSINPDIIIVMACGFDIDRTRKELVSFLENEQLKSLKSLKNNQIYIIDANQFFVRPGPRIVDSLRILCEILYPDNFIRNYQGTGWQNL